MRLTPSVAGFRSEYPAGFKLECMAGFVGTRTQRAVGEPTIRVAVQSHPNREAALVLRMIWIPLMLSHPGHCLMASRHSFRKAA